MILDIAKIFVEAGAGGNGCVSFRREKFIPFGGPDGGDGGKGGNVIIVVDKSKRTLIDFHYKPKYVAHYGEHGKGANRFGRHSDDLIIKVPPGSIIKDFETKEILADLDSDGKSIIVAKGGRGGRGNTSFTNSIRQAPRLAEKGEPGEKRWLEIELKIIADVGIIGFPNAGKSTLLSKISAAHPKIANYPFTTLAPNLGVVKFDDGIDLVWADMPGLIENAHNGVGLGHNFLRHIERTKILVHIVDMGAFDRDPILDFQIIMNELKLYNPKLLKLPQVIAVNKMDLKNTKERFLTFKKYIKRKYKIFPISAIEGKGVNELVQHIVKIFIKVNKAKEKQIPKIAQETKLYKYEPRFTIHKENNVYYVDGKEPKKWVAMTDMENVEALERLWFIFDKMGLIKALKNNGIKYGDIVKVGDEEFDYDLVQKYKP
ncbi:MAG: GTPase ObgE [Candidatus Firestonebacteria bacterium]